MKGQAISLATTMIVVLMMAGAMLAVYLVFRNSVAPAGGHAQNTLLGVGINGLVIFGGAKRNSTKKRLFSPCRSSIHRTSANSSTKKGIVLTTTLLATIIFVVVICLVLFLIFAGVQANAGSTGGGFFYGTFDAIMKIISGVV